MNATTQLTEEQLQQAKRANALGFISQIMTFGGTSQNEAVQLYKRACFLYDKLHKKSAAIRQALEEHIKVLAPAK
jgi:hypothetical protein